MPPAEPPATHGRRSRRIQRVAGRRGVSGRLQHPADPGRVTMRRLNRAEYNHTIRDLIGIDFQPAADFPADDIGYGFDNVGDVLSVSPLLVEKYFTAAERIVDEAARSPSVWRRIMNPPADDPVPFVLRGNPPLRDGAVKSLAGADGPGIRCECPGVGAGGSLAALVRRPRLSAADESRTSWPAWCNSSKHAQRNGEPADAGVRLALQAILVSPHFLFKVEPLPSSKQPLNDFELATRLSYFLWASAPDEELFRSAAAGRLHNDDTLPAQVGRMLRDPKSRSLAADFRGAVAADAGTAGDLCRTQPGSRTSMMNFGRPCSARRNFSSTPWCARIVPSSISWTPTLRL